MASQEAAPGQVFPLQLPGQELGAGLGSKGATVSALSGATGIGLERGVADFFINCCLNCFGLFTAAKLSCD